MSPELIRLADILIAIKRALGFIQGYDAGRFQSDKRTQWAVYSQIIIIGEAARRISTEFQERYAAIPWPDMIGMRHKLVHDYDEIDWELVWDTITVDLPKLKTAIEPLIPKEPQVGTNARAK